MVDGVLAHSEALVGLLSLILVLVTAYGGFRMNQLRERRSHTLNVLVLFSTNEVLAEADRVVAGRLAQPQPITNDIEPEFDRHLMHILDHYELIATSFKLGILDKTTVAHLRGGAMKRLYRMAEPYIITRRDMLERPELYKQLEDVTLQLGRVPAAS